MSFYRDCHVILGSEFVKHFTGNIKYDLILIATKHDQVKWIEGEI